PRQGPAAVPRQPPHDAPEDRRVASERRRARAAPATRLNRNKRRAGLFQLVSPLTTNRLDQAQGGTSTQCPQPSGPRLFLKAAGQFSVRVFAGSFAGSARLLLYPARRRRRWATADEQAISTHSRAGGAPCDGSKRRSPVPSKIGTIARWTSSISPARRY